jgi:hypothetical protein
VSTRTTRASRSTRSSTPRRRRPDRRDFLPYVWITAGQASSPARIEPLVENGLGGRGNVIDAGQTLYAGIDLDPHSASNAVAGYTTLEVIPNRIAGAGDKGARALQLPAPAKVADAQLGTYSRDIAGALKAMTYASIPEE